MISDTTRRFSRTLSDAFADERAEWFERPPQKEHWAVKIALWLAVVAIILSICLVSAP